MKQAILLAEKAMHIASPNPTVGTVVVKDGKIVGQGVTEKYGGAHAEVVAIAEAGAEAKGATLYTTLEPCSHFGKTGPCSQALIKAGVAEVHMAILDPSKKVNGQGRSEMEKAGIKVVVGEHSAEVEKLHEFFIKHVKTGLPFVFLKWAMTADGFVARSNQKPGEQFIISGPEAKINTHKLRQSVDAILVGAETIVKDDPSLTVRLENVEARHPIRIILDTTGRTPVNSKVISGGLLGKTIVATTNQIDLNQKGAYKKNGVEVIVLESKEGNIDLDQLLKKLGDMKITSLLVEGGPTIHKSFIDQNLVDKLLVYVSQDELGKGVPAALNIDQIEEKFLVEKSQIRKDEMLIGYILSKRSKKTA